MSRNEDSVGPASGSQMISENLDSATLVFKAGAPEDLKHISFSGESQRNGVEGRTANLQSGVTQRPSQDGSRESAEWMMHRKTLVKLLQVDLMREIQRTRLQRFTHWIVGPMRGEELVRPMPRVVPHVAHLSWLCKCPCSGVIVYRPFATIVPMRCRQQHNTCPHLSPKQDLMNRLGVERGRNAPGGFIPARGCWWGSTSSPFCCSSTA